MNDTFLYFYKMVAKTQINIKESKSELKLLRKSSKSQREKTRILFLLLKLESKFKSQKELSRYLDVSESTIRRWTNTYNKFGLKQFLNIPLGGKRREVITHIISKGLKERLEDLEHPFTGYNDAVKWVEKRYGVKIEYNTLRTYMKRHYKTKLKVSRKSCHKKEEQVVIVFKKFSNYN